MKKHKGPLGLDVQNKVTLIERREVMAIMNPYNYSKPIGAVNTNLKNESKNVEKGLSGKTKSDMYLEQKIMNARPEELTLLLYDGLVKFINQIILFNEQKTFEKSNTANLRAQAILQELRSSLNLDIEISDNLENLYLYMLERLVDSNITKDSNNIDEVLDLATDLRDTWKEAMNL